MKTLAIYEYLGYNIHVYEDGTCDIADVWSEELIDGDFANNKKAEQYIWDFVNGGTCIE